MTKHKLANEMIISNGARRSWKYRLRDLLILLVTWGGWLFLALQPWFNYLETEEDESFIGSLDAIEVIFDIDGFGLLGFNSIVDRDYPVVMGILLISSLLLLVGNILSDLLVAVIDPRIRFR